MTIVLALSAILFTTFYTFVASELADAAAESSEIKVQGGIRTPMSELVEELQDAHLYALDSYANWVCYQIPQTGPSGSIIVGADANNNPTVAYGAVAFDGSGWIPGGYYQIVFVNHTAAADVLKESKFVTAANPLGQNLSGTFGTGTSNVSISYDKGYQVGHFEIQCHAAPLTLMTATNKCLQHPYGFPGGRASAGPYGPGGALVPLNGANTRIISGTALRQIDPTDGSDPIVGSEIARTSPYGGGFFFMRNPLNTDGLAQTPDVFLQANDKNGNGVYDYGEVYGDSNLNNIYDGPDCIGFPDINRNNVVDGFDTAIPTGWVGSLRIQMCAFDLKKLVTTNGDLASTTGAAVRTISTKVKIRN